MTGKTTSRRVPLPLRSRGTNAASVGSAVIMTRWPPLRTSGSIFCAALPMSQWPSLVIPMGTASYLSGSSPRMTEAAEASETSCSPERPPKRIPMRRRFFSWVMGVVRRQVSVISEKEKWWDGCFWPRSELTMEELHRCCQCWSKDFLAEAGEDEFDAEKSSAVVFVEDWVDLNDFHGNH